MKWEDSLTDEQRKKHHYNKKIAFLAFKEDGLIPEDATGRDYVLHHKDPTLRHTNIERYIEWRMEDLVPMTISEHTKTHWTGRHHSEETKQKMSEAHKGNQNAKGKHWSDESRARASAERKGRIISAETRAKISASNKGRKLTEETKKKLSEALKGRHWTLSEEVRARMSESHKGQKGYWTGKHHTEETKAKMSKPKSEETKARMVEAQRKRRERERAEKEAV